MLLWTQYSGIFLKYAKYADLEIANINTPETKDLKVINNVGSWDFLEQKEIM